MIMENNSLNGYHIAQCLNLIDFLRDRRSSSTKIILDFLDDSLKLQVKERVTKTSMSEGMHVWITAELNRVYFETYYIHPHNNDEQTIENGSIEIDNKLLGSVRDTLIKMTEHKLKEEYQKTVESIEHNKIKKENDRINYMISDMVTDISLGKSSSEIDCTELKVKPEQVKTDIMLGSYVKIYEMNGLRKQNF